MHDITVLLIDRDTHADVLVFYVSDVTSIPRTCCAHSYCKSSDVNFADKIRHVRDPKARMQVVWGYCKGKMVCDSDDAKEEEGMEGEEHKKSHGGCGAVQPLIRKEGLKLFVQYKRSKDEDEVRST